MNIFAIEYDKDGGIDWIKSAQSLDNLRVVKMVTETAQILSTALAVNGFSNSKLYKSTHEKHPSVLYASAGNDSFCNTLTHGLALYEEYKARYNNKIHKAGELTEYVNRLYLTGYLDSYLTTTLVDFKNYLAVPEGYRESDPVKSYRRFYANKDRLVYPKDKLPDWVAELRFNYIPVKILT